MATVTQPTSFDLKPLRNPDAAEIATAPGRTSAETPWFLDPREILLVLRSRSWLALAPAAAFLALALCGLLVLSPQYMATTQILIDPQALQVLKDDLKPSAQPSDASLLLVDSEMLVLSSDDVLLSVVNKFGLDRDSDFVQPPSLVGRLVNSITGLLTPSSPAPDPKLVALRSLRERLTTQRLERSFVLSVSVTTGSRELSRRLAQGVAETYLELESAHRVDTARRASAALMARLSELQASLRSAEDEAQSYKTANNLVGTRTQLVSEQQLGQIGDQLGAARARAAQQLSRLNQIENVLKSGGQLNAMPEVLQSPTVGQLRTQLAQAERILADDTANLGARHPSMMAAQVQVTTARAQLDAEIRRIAASVRTEYNASMANVASLQTTLDSDKTEAVSVGDAMVHLRELDQQIEARRNLYGSFLARSRELQEQQRVDNSASRIISPATPPAYRKGPPGTVVLAAALAIGLGAGVGLALLADAVTGRIRTSRRFRQRLDLPLLGALPPTNPQAAAQGASGAYDIALARAGDHLATRLGRNHPHVVIVTSADSVSGKSLLALRLAATAAADQDRVLLVDADPEGSITDDLTLSINREPPRVREGRIVVQDGRLADFPRLRFMTAERLALRTDYRAAVEAIFQRAGDLDMVIVNAGVLGADLFTDRLASDPRVSLVLLAASAARSSFGPIERALSRLGGHPTLACMLTDASRIDA